jgi:hypothetical protein
LKTNAELIEQID